MSASLINLIVTGGLAGRENSWHLSRAEKGAGKQVNVNREWVRQLASVGCGK